MIRLFVILIAMAIGGSFVAVAEAPNQVAECKHDTSYSINRLTGKPAPADCARLSGSAGDVPVGEVTNAAVAPDERTTAAIFYVGADGKRHICTGVLIDANHILTASHCACGRAGTYSVTFSQIALQGNSILNEIKITQAPIPFDRLACVLGIRPGNDLALIKLPGPMFVISDEGYGYPAFALASQLNQQVKPGRPLKVVGFGETQSRGVAVRMKAEIPVLTSDCLARPYNFYCAPFVEMILADRRGGRASRDTCGGDSGGPVFVDMSVELPRCGVEGAPVSIRRTIQVLVGITSRAAPFTHAFSAQHCGGGGIYSLIGRRSVQAWFAINQVKKQTCLN